MSIDLLPFSAFALESCAAPATMPGEGQTLTLALRQRNSASLAMSGSIALRAVQAPLPGSVRAEVTQVDAAAVTLTF